ncbi:MAG: MarR family winged helix-turn-helix transcriptional regulator [Pseudolactococcus laudensis]
MTSEFQSEHAEDSAQSIGFSFIKAYNIWHRKIKTDLLAIGLTHPQFVTLAALGYLQQQQEEVNQIDIAVNTDMDVMTVSTIVRNLEKQALINRNVSKIDSRAKVITITSQGSFVLNQALKIVEDIDRTYFSVLKEDKNVFNDLLHLLIQKNS